MAVMAAAFDRLTAGKRTYGSFSPAMDRRDLRREAEEELLDAIVYCYLALLQLEHTSIGEKAWIRRPRGIPPCPNPAARGSHQVAPRATRPKVFGSLIRRKPAEGA